MFSIDLVIAIKGEQIILSSNDKIANITMKLNNPNNI
jgi:hypothetical protein